VALAVARTPSASSAVTVNVRAPTVLLSIRAPTLAEAVHAPMLVPAPGVHV